MMHAIVTISLILFSVFLVSPVMQSHVDWLNEYREDCSRMGGTVIKPSNGDHICIKELKRDNQ